MALLFMVIHATCPISTHDTFLTNKNIFKKNSKNLLTNNNKCIIIYHVAQVVSHSKFRGVAQLVARLVWDQDAASSNLVTPTKKLTIYENNL